MRCSTQRASKNGTHDQSSICITQKPFITRHTVHVFHRRYEGLEKLFVLLTLASPKRLIEYFRKFMDTYNQYMTVFLSILLPKSDSPGLSLALFTSASAYAVVIGRRLVRLYEL